MRDSWATLQAQALMPVDSIARTIDDVFVEECDEPQLVTLREGEQRYIGIVSDGDAEGLRWLHIPVTSVQWAALVHGSLDFYDLCMLATLSVVDTDFELSPQRMWITRGIDLDPRNIPLPGAKLPAHVREQEKRRLGAGSAHRIVVGKSNSGATVSLSDLGLIATRYQVLWTECALASVRPSTHAAKRGVVRGANLRPRSAVESSFDVQVEPASAAVFASAAEMFQALLRASTDSASLIAFLNEYPPALRNAFMAFLIALRKRSLEVMTTWESGTAYVGPWKASMGRRRKRPSIRPRESQTRRLHGHFRGFNREDATFVFKVDEVDELVQGVVTSTLVEWAAEKSIVVGHDTQYRITVEESYREDGSLLIALAAVENYGEAEFQTETDELEEWFRSHYVDANDEVSTAMIEGTVDDEPLDARDELEDHFPDANPQAIDAVVRKLENESTDWLRLRTQ